METMLDQQPRTIPILLFVISLFLVPLLQAAGNNFLPIRVGENRSRGSRGEAGYKISASPRAKRPFSSTFTRPAGIWGS